MIHTSRLHKKPFDLIASGKKTIEIRLFDEKRQKFKLLDTLCFIDRETGECIQKKIVGMKRYQTFDELINDNSIKDLGRDDTGLLRMDLNIYYTAEDETKYGVIAIYLL